MKIIVRVLLITVLYTCLFSSCGMKPAEEPLVVYSFSGENEMFSISNGVIVLNGTEEIFAGGDLKVTGDLPADITSYSTTFYTMSGSERDVILSDSTVDMTGGMVNVSGDLGQISGDSIIRRIKIDDVNDLENVLYFELTTQNKSGEENVYQLQMSLTKITKNAGD